MKNMNIDIDKSIMSIHTWAIGKHSMANHKYDGLEYSVHLNATLNVALKYIKLIPAEDQECVLNAVSCHDLIEDARMTYNDIVNETSVLCADIVYAVTDELGKNRKERATKTYPKIASSKLATFVKLCDRIANIKYSYFTGEQNGMFKKYQKEFDAFYQALYNDEHNFGEMWQELKILCTIK